jgi:iron complex outermembrane recepter protein
MATLDGRNRGLHRNMARIRGNGGVRAAQLIALGIGLAHLLPAAAQTAPAETPAAAPAEAPAAEAPKAPKPREVAADATTALPEIVITATRHSEVMSKVPISVSAFSQETLDVKGAKDISDVARFTPGITIDNDGSNSISIRGIASSAGAATTGIYIDDTPIQMRTLGFNSDNALPKAFDLERIEVLRGPQGTLFGAGAEGGAVRYIMAQPNMNKPDLYVRSEVAQTQGGAPSYEAGVAGGAPIIDNVLGFRASIWFRHDGGWIDRLDPTTYQTVAKDTNYTNTFAMRLAAKWAVNDSVTITPSVLYQNKQTNDITLYWPILSNPGSSYKNAEPDPRPEPDYYVLPSLKIETEIGNASLISNTSYYLRSDTSGYSGTIYNLSYYQTFNSNDIPNPGYSQFVDPSLYPLVDGNGLHLPPGLQNYRATAPVSNQQKTFAQEFRLQSNDPNAPLTWTTGVFFSTNNQTSIEEINDPMLPQFFNQIFGYDYTQYFVDLSGNPVPLLANGDSYYNYNFSRDKQLAVFGEATYAVTEKLKATVGARYSKTDVDFNHFSAGPQNFGTIAGAGEQHEKPFTPKLGIAYQADRDNLYYATYAKGFRIGGANGGIPSGQCLTDLAALGLTAEPGSYKSDSVNSFEIGAKNKIADRLRIASSIYYIKWNGIQQNVYMPTCGFQFTTNFGEAVSKGGDIQLDYAPNAAWNFEMTIGHTDARYTSDATSGTSLFAAKGDAVEGLVYGPAPPWTATVGAQYDFVALDRKSFVRVDYEYQGHSSEMTATEDPRTGANDPYIFTPKAYGFVSLRAGTTVDKWNVSAFVDNLLNAHPQILDSSDAHSGADAYKLPTPSVLITSYTLRPRTMGLTATYHY